MHKLERLILESFAELTEEEQGKGTYGLEELPKAFRDSVEKRYGVSKWPDKDFVSSDMQTYFKTTSVDKTTGNIGHTVIKLPSFEGLYSNFTALVADIRNLMNAPDIRQDKNARELFELIKTNFRKLQRYLRIERPDQYELMKMRRISEDINESVELIYSHTALLKEESLWQQLEEEEGDEEPTEEPTPEEEPDTEAAPDTVLEDSTDTILAKFPTVKAALIKLQTEDFKEFVDSIDWISPRPSSFRVNLKNGQDYILKWTGKTFEAQIMGKRYSLSVISEYQQALDKLALLYKEAPMSGAGEGEAPDTDSGGGGGGGGEFPGGEGGAEGGEEDFGAEDGGGGDEAPADLGGEEIDFEDETEEPEA